MSALESLNVGIVGACGRGKSFSAACDALDIIRVHAVCDTNADGLDEAAARLGADEKFTDYDRMLDRSDLDAVIIGTPMQLHVPQAIAALARGLHVLSEVPAGVSIEECQALAVACNAGKGVYMMAENYTYRRQNVIVREIARAGLLGTLYYAEGEYLHEFKGLNEVTRWRRKWQTGINGITYGTHSLGPILQWMNAPHSAEPRAEARGCIRSGSPPARELPLAARPVDRVVSVCCAGSGHHYRDPGGDEYENEDSGVMLCRMRSGGLVKIRVDMLSDRPHAMTNYQVQGTDGCYESARAPGEGDRIWLRARARAKDEWQDLAELADEFLPQYWKAGMAAAAQAGHGGGDYFEVLDFVDAVVGTRPPTVGIHEAMDMTLPGLVSQQSIQQGGAWLDVPDSRLW